MIWLPAPHDLAVVLDDIAARDYLHSLRIVENRLVQVLRAGVLLICGERALGQDRRRVGGGTEGRLGGALVNALPDLTAYLVNDGRFHAQAELDAGPRTVAEPVEVARDHQPDRRRLPQSALGTGDRVDARWYEHVPGTPPGQPTARWHGIHGGSGDLRGRQAVADHLDVSARRSADAPRP